MKTQNKIIFSAVLALLFVTNVYGTSTGYDYAEDAPKLADKMKFGIHLGVGFINKWGVFGEYKVNEAIGIQTALLIFSDLYVMQGVDNVKDHNSFIMPKYVAVPLLLRLYPGKKRQFCMYTGLQLNRIIGGFILDINPKEEPEELNPSSLIKEIKSRGSKLKNDKGIRKWHTHFIFGLDQEWRNGVQLGTEIGSGLSSAKKCDKKFVDFTWKITLGYNFAKLFE